MFDELQQSLGWRERDQLTKWEFFSWVRRESEAQDRHGGDEKARHQQVVEVVESPPSDLDNEGDVQVGLWAAVVDDFIPLGGDAFNVTLRWEVTSENLLTNHFPLSIRDEGADVSALFGV